MHSVMTIMKMTQEEMGENVIIKWVQLKSSSINIKKKKKKRI